MGIAGFGPHSHRIRPLGPPSTERLQVNFITAVRYPILATLFSSSHTTRRASSFLRVQFSCSWYHTGLNAGNMAASAIFSVDGTALEDGTAQNKTRSQVTYMAFDVSVPVVAGVHPVLVDMALFGAGVNNFNIFALPASMGGNPLSFLWHAALHLTEHL